MFVKEVNSDAFSPKEIIIKIMGYSHHIGKGVRHVEIAGEGAEGPHISLVGCRDPGGHPGLLVERPPFP